MPQQFFTIEVYFLHGSEAGRYLYRNFTGKELKNLRETIIAAGLAIPIDAEHYKIILPSQITSIEVWRQEKFFHQQISKNETVHA